MNNLPAITIIMTTWAPAGEVGMLRANAAKETIESWMKYLKYDGQLGLHVADDGSDYEDYAKTLTSPPACWWKGPISLSSQDRKGVGASLNGGIRKVVGISPLFAYFVDDWMLTGEMDLTPWAKTLMANDNIGMIRLGPPHPYISGPAMMFAPGGWGLLLERHHFAFGFRPALYHKRIIGKLGWFDEGVSSLECEKLYNLRWGQDDTIEIVYALPYPWDHIYTKELSEIVPGG